MKFGPIDYQVRKELPKILDMDFSEIEKRIIAYMDEERTTLLNALFGAKSDTELRTPRPDQTSQIPPLIARVDR